MNRDDLIKRYIEMEKMWKDGISTNKIGDKFGISGARVRWILGHKMPEKRYEDTYKKTGVKRKNSDDRLEIIKILGGKCVRCGYDKDVRALKIDHTNGGGGDERKKYTSALYWIVLDMVRKGERKKYQVLCANCNTIKRITENEFGKARIKKLQNS